MPSTVTNENKNTAAVTNETKPGSEITIDEVVANIDDVNGTIDEGGGSVVTNDSKNTATVTNETKN